MNLLSFLHRARSPRRGQTLDLTAAAARGDLNRLVYDNPTLRARLSSGRRFGSRRGA